MPTISTLVVDVQARTSKFSAGIKGAVVGLGALATGAAYAFGQFEESEKITKQTEAVLKSTGDAANVTADQIGDLANAISLKSGIDDEAIQSGENLLLTFTNIRNEVGKGNDIFNQATQTITDMSVALGQDMKSSAIQVGKALNDPVKGITALRRVGVSFTDQQTEQIAKLQESGHTLQAQKLILAELTKEFGGSAAAQATSGEKMKVAFDNLAETVGKVLAPAINLLLDGLNVFIAFLQANVGPALQKAREWFAKVWERIGPFVTIVGQAAVHALKSMWASLEPILPQLAKLWKAIQPILKVLAVLVGALLYVALKVLPIVFHALAIWIGILVRVYTTVAQVVDKIISIFGKVVDFFHHLPSKLAAAGRGMWDWITDGLKSALNLVISLLNKGIDFINRFQIHVHEGLGPLPDLNFDWNGPQIPHIPSLDMGGLVQRTGLAIVHEGERYSGVGGGWGNVTVNVYGSVMTENDLATSIQKALLKTKRRSGALGLA